MAKSNKYSKPVLQLDWFSNFLYKLLDTSILFKQHRLPEILT